MNRISLFLLLLFSLNFACAQKLPNIQTTSVWGYQKIDPTGSFDFQAFNHATDIYYAISNDNENIFLTIQVRNKDIINKVVKGGITFTIGQPNLNSDPERVSAQYPFIEKKDRLSFILSYKPDSQDPKIKEMQLDSFVNILNTQFFAKAKEIKLSGIKSLPDTISIYNGDNIKVVSFFDHNLAFNYQLTLPIKLLAPLRDKSSFFYNIASNGISMTEVGHELSSGITKLDVSDGVIVNVEGPSANIISQLIAKTDFSGEYKLARK